jgi:hypothetical protein
LCLDSVANTHKSELRSREVEEFNRTISSQDEKTSRILGRIFDKRIKQKYFYVWLLRHNHKEGISASNLCAVSKGRLKHHKGYVAKVLNV